MKSDHMRVPAIVRYYRDSKAHPIRTHADIFPDHFRFSGDYPGATSELGGEMYLCLSGSWYNLTFDGEGWVILPSFLGAYFDSILKRSESETT